MAAVMKSVPAIISVRCVFVRFTSIKQHLDFVNSLKPSDTKGLDDEQIVIIAKELMKTVPYSLLDLAE
jgi:ribonuclease HIII